MRTSVVRKLVFFSLLIGLIVWAFLAVENQNRRRAMVIGRWYYVSFEATRRIVERVPIRMNEDGTLSDGLVSSTWTYFNGKVTMAPQTRDEIVFILSEDGRHLRRSGETKWIFERRP